MSPQLALAIHDAQLAEHGGGSGLRGPELLASALERPRTHAAYAAADVPELAAWYAIGIIRNHPFVDGNKRVGAVLLETFLVLNGYALQAGDAELLHHIRALAAGEINDAAFTNWVRAHARVTS